LPTLTPRQAEFIARDERFRLLVAGFGSGKTWGGCASICKTAWEFPGADQGYFGPTHGHTRDIFYPTIEEVAADWGLDCTISPGNREVALSHAGKVRSVIRCRSMDRPDSIIGFKIARGVVDEIDTMPSIKATAAWRKIIARLRQDIPGLVNGADVTTTPEGFGFAYQTFEKAPRENPALRDLYSLTRCSTYENEGNLPPGYIESLKASYPANLIEAYLYGKFINLTQGSVYHEYDREKNASGESIQEGDVLYIGMDFNVGKMASIAHVKRAGEPHAVDEIINAFDTPDMIRLIKERYWRYIDGVYRKTHEIRVYPDSTGGSRKSAHAGTTDIQLLRDAGFIVSAPKGNPPVRDRVNAVNALIRNSEGLRRYRVNVDKCPTLAEKLEQQAYNDQGEPDKKNDVDHAPDAAGYFIHREYPLRRPATRINIGVAM
jgi:hypothetical protein